MDAESTYGDWIVLKTSTSKSGKVLCRCPCGKQKDEGDSGKDDE